MFCRAPALSLFCTALIAWFMSIPVFAQEEAPRQVLINNVMVWDGTSDSNMDVDVLIEDNKINCSRKCGELLVLYGSQRWN